MTAAEVRLIRDWSVLNGGGWKTSPRAATRVADRALRTSTVGPPPLSIAALAENLRRRLGTRIWTWT